jgi:hypothetical protein
MSTLPAVTMQDLELEHAELLPGRETLCSWRSHGSTNTFQSVATGNSTNNGLVQVAFLNGNILSPGSGNLIG